MTATLKCTQIISPENDSKPVMYGAVAVLFWSVGAYFFCILKDVPGFQLLALIQLGGGLLCLRLENRTLSLKNLINRLKLGWMFLLLLMINQLSYTWAFRLADPAQVDLINYLWPTLVIIIESACRGDRLTTKQICGLVASLIGIVVVLLPEISTIQSIGLRESFGYLLAFFAAVSWSLYTVLPRYFGKQKKGTYSISEDVILLGIFNLIIQLVFGSWKALDFHESYIVVFLAICYYGIAFPFWKKGLESKRYTLVGGFANTIPVLSVVWLIIGGISHWNITLFIACIFVTIGCVWIGTPVEKSKSPIKAI